MFGEVNHSFHSIDDLCQWKILTQSEGNGVRIIHVNVRSLRKNWNSLLIYLEANIDSIDVLVLTEVNIFEEELFLYELHGFSKNSKLRRSRTGGGIISFTRNSLQAKAIAIESRSIVENFELLVTEIDCHGKSLTVIAAYRPPDLSKGMFIAELESIISLFNNDELILIGDMNLNIMNENYCKQTRDYEDMLYSLGLERCIHEYTREEFSAGELKQSCIDHIYVRSKKSTSVTSAVIKFRIADHYAIGVNIMYDGPSTAGKRKEHASCRLIKIIDDKIVESKLKSYDWTSLTTIDDANELYNELTNVFTVIYNSATKFKLGKKRVAKGWITAELIQCIKEKDRLFKKWKQCSNKARETKWLLQKEYKKFRNQLHKKILKAKTTFYQLKFSRIINDMKETWNQINIVINKTSKLSVDETIMKYMGQTKGAECIANLFVNSFVSGIDEIKHTCDTTLLETSRDVNVMQSMFMPNITDQIVNTLIDDLNIAKSPGLDGIRVKDLKLIKTKISPVITKLINLTLQTGKIPTLLKTSIIRPIYKNGNHSECTNYRPIAILPSIEKICERYVANVLVSYLDKHRILTDMQFGFRKKMSTTLLLEKFSDYTNYKLNDNKHVLSIFVDFSKAFDTLRYDKLMASLHSIGIRGPIYEWFRDYLTDRQLIVKINDKLSNTLKFTSGVPQGSILGPTLYLIYVNEMINKLKNSKVFLYADDTAILVSHVNLDIAETILQKEFNKLLCWTHDNGLIINEKKTKIIHIRTPKQISREIKIKFHSCHCLKLNCINCQCNIYLENVESMKYLGLHIDCHFKWDVHIEKTRMKLRSCAFKLYQLKPYLPFKTMKIVYTALVESIVHYGLQVWGHSADYHLNVIIKLQKRILKSIIPNYIQLDTNQIFQFCDILPASSKFKHTIIIQNYFSMEHKITLSHNHITRNRDIHLIVPLYQNNYGRRLQNYSVPILFNSIPAEILKLERMSEIKFAVKRFLLY
jgi:endonuclease/exonuclease/phosphatase family metal-dependent hydrolase